MSAETSTPGAGPSTHVGAEPLSAFHRWRRSLAEFTGLGMDEDQLAQRDRMTMEDPDTVQRHWERCEKHKKELMETSPIVIFMLKHLKLSGCAFPESAIQCYPCPNTTAGGFHPTYGVMLCQNRYFSRRHLEDTLAHELIHAFDHCKFKVDWQNNLRHHACSEIRAANLSGDCRWGRELQRGQDWTTFNKRHQDCVRRRAALATSRHPKCDSMEMAEKTVSEVWESCFADTRPFDEVY